MVIQNQERVIALLNEINEVKGNFIDNETANQLTPELKAVWDEIFVCKNEIELIEYPLKAFEIVTTIGTTELFKIITDEALSYIEDKATEKGISFFSRKNWFGLYPILKNKLGLEIKC